MIEGFYKTPPTYENVKIATDYLRRTYKQLKVFPIGKSALGRDIDALCIGNPVGGALMVGATHGLEWMTTLLLIRFCEDVLEGMATGGQVSDIDVGSALRNRPLVIIPCLNPDGVEIALNGPAAACELEDEVGDILDGRSSGEVWQANAHGVDLNHNFDAGWCILREMEKSVGIDGPAPTRYGGPHAVSEPESRAVTTFCMTYQPRSLYSFHSQGEEIYYRYGENTPQRSRLMAQILACSSSYRLEQPTGLASHGGLKDWFIERFRRPGFTIEIGRGKNPLEITQFEQIYAKIQEMLIIAALL